MFEKPIPDFLERYIGEPDSRLSGWPGLRSPVPILTLYTLYGLVLTLGRHLITKSSASLQLRGVLVIYNALQILLNAYILEEIFACALGASYGFACEYEGTTDSNAMRLARAVWLHYLSKAIDLMDTVFFVLRKKNDQITFLHVYHHCTMVLGWYFGALYSPGGQAWACIAINAGIHVVMYLYYLLSALGPDYRRYLWWKKYLTRLQLIQFFVIEGQLIYLLCRSCAKPVWLAYVTLFYNATLIALFCSFYKKTYRRCDVEKAPDVKARQLNHRTSEKSRDEKKQS